MASFEEGDRVTVKQTGEGGEVAAVRLDGVVMVLRDKSLGREPTPFDLDELTTPSGSGILKR
jgi:hypothetical protein